VALIISFLALKRTIAAFYYLTRRNNAVGNATVQWFSVSVPLPLAERDL
jgi:hypothetical protein